jgi:hypothetical protein
MFKGFLQNKWSPGTCAFALYLLIFVMAAQAAAQDPILPSVQPFPLGDVGLLDGPFKHAQDLNEKVLLRYEPDRFIAGSFFFVNGGSSEQPSSLQHPAFRAQTQALPEFFRVCRYLI